MTTPTRWLRFNAIGVIGFGVQLATLSLLLRWTPLAETLAVAVAVLLTVSHNFVWHEHVTWRGQSRQGRWQRWVAFNMTNGAISLVTNVVATSGLMTAIGISAVSANAAAVLGASVVNFIASDRFVFKGAATGANLFTLWPRVCIAVARASASERSIYRLRRLVVADRCVRFIECRGTIRSDGPTLHRDGSRTHRTGPLRGCGDSSHHLVSP